MLARLPRDLHPGGLVGVGDRALNRGVLHHQPVPAADAGGRGVRRGDGPASDQPWAGSFRLYVWVGVVIVVIRVVFRILLRDGYGHRAVRPAEIPLPDWVAGIRLLGPVTLESLLAGLYDGLRLATS